MNIFGAFFHFFQEPSTGFKGSVDFQKFSEDLQKLSDKIILDAFIMWKQHERLLEDHLREIFGNYGKVKESAAAK